MQTATIETLLTAGLAATGALVPGVPVAAAGLAAAGVLLKEGAKIVTEWTEQGKLNAELEKLRQEQQTATLLNEAFRALGIQPIDQADLLTQILDLTRIAVTEVSELTCELQYRRNLNHLLVSGAEEILGKPSPAELLRANHEVVPFYGRTDDLALLDRWQQSEEPIGVLLFAGPGGAGKTRLLLHWCRQLRQQGYIAGFLPDSVDQSALEPIIEIRDRLVVVIDYAETRQDLIVGLLDRAGQAWNGGRSLQLVLLARRVGDWWEEIKEKTARVRQIVTKCGYAGEISKLLPDLSQRVVLYEQSLKSMAERLECSVPTAPIPAFDQDEFAHPLFVQMAALAVLAGRPVSNPADLLEDTLAHEQRYWNKAIEAVGFDDKTLIRAVREIVDRVSTLLTLWGSVHDHMVVHEIIANSGLLPEGQPHIVKRVDEDIFQKLYCRNVAGEDRIFGLEPDLLGEQLVAQQLRKSPERRRDLLGAAFSGVSDEQGAHGFTVLTRLATRDPRAREWLELAIVTNFERWASIALKVACESGGPLGEVLAETLQQSPRPHFAAVLVERVPTRTTALRRFAAVATEQAIEWLEQQEIVEYAELARLKNHLGIRYSALGRHEEALATTKEAVKIRRDLAQAHPGDFRPELATLLNSLGNRYSDLGRHEEAMEATKEAVEIRRELVRISPVKFKQDLALALNSLGNRCSDLGRPEEALEATKEAVDLFRELNQTHPGAFRPELATGLKNLGDMLNAVGRRKYALEVTIDAVDLFRELVQVHADAFGSELASALMNLGGMLNAIGCHEDALDVTREAVEYFRDLAQVSADAFKPDLASALHNLGVILNAIGCPKDALDANKGAVEHFRYLIQVFPSAFRPKLASSLSSLGNRYGDLDHHEEGLEAHKEAVAIFRDLVRVRPDAHYPDLAVALNSLGNRYSDLGRHEEALEAHREAVQIQTPFFLHLPSAFAYQMEAMVRNYLTMCRELRLEPELELLEPIKPVLTEMIKKSDKVR